MLSRSRISTTGLLIGLMVSGCSGPDHSETTSSPGHTTIPSDFEMVFGEGGGMTGSWSGYTITPNGLVKRWDGPVAGSNEQPAGTLQTSEIVAIWRDIVETEFFDYEIDERGEITAFVRVTADSIEHSVAWIPGVENIEPPRNPVEELYRRTRTIAQGAAVPAAEDE